MKKSNVYEYPCIITYDKSDGVYYVNFPDLEDCFTDGDTMKEALINAEEVLGLYLYTKEEHDMDIPNPRNSFIKTEENQSISYVSVWMPLVRDEIEQKSVKKTLTIPKWLNDLAEDNGVNFSKLLQVSLKDYLGIKNY